MDGRPIPVMNETDPANIAWKEAGVDIVVESTGKFKDHKSASKHLAGGAKKVVITAPGKDADATIVMGVNEETYDPDKHHIVSNGSCTTNCLAPVAKVLSTEFGIVRGMMTTVHSYTNDQHLLIRYIKDFVVPGVRHNPLFLRLRRSSGRSPCFARTEGKFTGMALRVPTPNVSMTDLVAVLEKNEP